MSIFNASVGSESNYNTAACVFAVACLVIWLFSANRARPTQFRILNGWVIPAVRTITMLLASLYLLSTCVHWCILSTHGYHGNDHPRRPLIIAHRGASGVFPEHSAAAYEQAIADGADYIECDVVVTRDLHLVCLHDLILDLVTNVADVFPTARQRTLYDPDEQRNVTGYFVFDFSLDELKLLRLRQRRPTRDPRYNGMYPIPTFDEFLSIANAASRSVGIYPELKVPTLFNTLSFMIEARTTVEHLLIDKLQRYNFASADDRCFIQSFDLASLERLHQMTHLPLIMLLDAGADVSDESLHRYATICKGLGVSKSLVITPNSSANPQVMGNTTDLIDRAHTLDLKVHAWTFRNEAELLFWDYKMNPCNEYQQFLSRGLDGYFSDFPETAIHCLSCLTNAALPHFRSASSVSVCIQVATAAVLFVFKLYI